MNQNYLYFNEPICMDNSINMTNLLPKSWTYHSSPMNWCEDKYTHSEYIVEYWNSLSSLCFTLFALLGYFIHRNYKTYNKDFNMVLQWFLFGLIGLTSFWFHSTLSFAGQFADEFSIIIYLVYTLKQLYRLSNLLFIFTIFIMSLISWFMPFVSPFFLLISGTILVCTTKIGVATNNEKQLWNKKIKGNEDMFMQMLMGGMNMPEITDINQTNLSFSKEQEDKIRMTMDLNPGVSREDVIKELKRVNEL